MSNQIRLKRASGSDPGASDLVLGEPAVRTDTGEIFLKKDDGSIAKVAGGIDDGDKGDVTVSNSGATFTIDSGVINNAKIASNASMSLSKLEVITSNRIVGNDSGNAVPKELTAAEVRTIINVENGATADQTASDIKTLLNSSGLVNAQIDGSAAVAGTKISPDFGSQNIVTTGTLACTDITSSDGTPSIKLNDSANNQFAFIDGNSGNLVLHSDKGGTGSSSTMKFGIDNVIKMTLDASGNLTLDGTVDGRDVATDGTKLDGIAAGATNVTNTNQLTNGAGFITATLTNEQVQDIVGGMVTGNTESGIAVTYQDGDGTLDFVVGTLNQNTTGSSASCTGNAATATQLANARTIAGVSFNGTANISLNNNAITNGAGYITSADGGNAATLDSLDSTAFLRSNASDSASGALTFTGGLTTNLTSISNGILEVKAVIATSHTLTADYNALAVSPTINNGVTVTVPSGAVWAIV